MTNTITFPIANVDGRIYKNYTWIVVKEEEFTHKANERTWFVLRKPRGKVEYRGCKYENGAVYIFR